LAERGERMGGRFGGSEDYGRKLRKRDLDGERDEIGIVRGYGVRNNIPVIMILKICNPDPDMYIITAFMGILSSG
jgi:hypothetical protein